jgi:Spy/CpxP family protein refolding chaperone
MAWMKQVFLATGFMVFGAIAATAFRAAAEEPPPSDEFGGHPRMEALVQELDLDANQQAALQALLDARREMREDRMSERMERRDEMIDLITAEKPDRKEIHREIDARAAERVA